MKKIITIVSLLGAILPGVALAAPTSWDFANSILQPLTSQRTIPIKVHGITATSTTYENTLPRLNFTNATGTAATTTSFFSTLGNFTNLCIGGDCKSAWPSGATVAGSDTQVQFNDGSAFGADADFTFEKLLNRLTVTNSVFTNSTSTNATSTTLNVSGNVDFDLLTSALLLTGAGGDVAEYAGTSCTNQFVRSLSALGAATCASVANTDLANSTISGISLGSNLADLTATNGTLTFSGAYNGGTARTIGLNLASANTWTGDQIFGNATSTNFFSTTASSTNLRTTGLGVASSTPVSAIGVGAGKAITVGENKLATSTSMTIDWTAGNQQLIQKGGAGITLSFSNVNPGARLSIIACNPGGTGGSITWPTSPTLLWPAATAPTQTTTANKCDLYTFAATVATSTATTLIFGGYNQDY